MNRILAALFTFVCLCLTGNVLQAQSLPVTIEIYPDGNPQTITLQHDDDGDGVSDYDYTPTQNVPWTKVTSTDHSLFEDELIFDLTRIPTAPKPTIAQNTTTQVNLIDHETTTKSNTTQTWIKTTKQFSHAQYFWDDVNVSDACTTTAHAQASCVLTPSGGPQNGWSCHGPDVPVGCTYYCNVNTNHPCWGCTKASYSAAGSDSETQDYSCTASVSASTYKSQNFPKKPTEHWTNAHKAYSNDWTFQETHKRWTGSAWAATASTHPHFYDRRFSAITWKSGSKVCVKGGHIRRNATGNQGAIKSNNVNWNPGGNWTSWSTNDMTCQTNAQGLNTFNYFKGSDGVPNSYMHTAGFKIDRSASASQTKDVYSHTSCSWSASWWSDYSSGQMAGVITECSSSGPYDSKTANASLDFHTLGYYNAVWDRTADTGEKQFNIEVTESGVIGTTAAIDKVIVTLNSPYWQHNNIWMQKLPNGPLVHLRNNWSKSGQGSHNISHTFSDTSPNPPATSNGESHNHTRPWSHAFHEAYDGVEINGTWQVTVTDHSGLSPTKFVNFYIDFVTAESAEWISPTAKSTTHSTIGSDSRLESVTIHHNIVSYASTPGDDLTWILHNATTGVEWELPVANVISGQPIDLYDETTHAQIGAGNSHDDWYVSVTSSSPIQNFGKEITSWSMDFSSAEVNGVCETDPNSSRPIAARVIPSHLSPTCDLDNGELVLYQQETGAPATSTFPPRMADGHHNHTSLEDGTSTSMSSTGMRYVQTAPGVFDVYDLVNDEHYIGGQFSRTTPSNQIKTNNGLFTLDLHSLHSPASGDDNDLIAGYHSTIASGAATPFLRTLVDDDRIQSVWAENNDGTTSTPATIHFLSDNTLTNLGNNTYITHGAASFPVLETNPENWDNWIGVSSLVDIPKNAPAEPLTSAGAVEQTQFTPDGAVSDQATSITPSWLLHPTNLPAISDVSNSATKPLVLDPDINNVYPHMALTPTGGAPWLHPQPVEPGEVNTHMVNVTPVNMGEGLWRTGADVDAYYSNDLHTKIDEATSTISVSFPLTPPYYTHGSAITYAYSNADAIKNHYPYWGIQNGTQGYAEIYVKLTDTYTGATHTVYQNSKDNPLILKDCPFILQDSIRIDILKGDLPTNPETGLDMFLTGDPIDIETVVMWTTDARRTVLWSKDEPRNQLVICGPPDDAFVMTDQVLEDQEYLTGISAATVTWNELLGKQSNGGAMRLQRRSTSTIDNPDGSWEYFKNTHIVASADNPNHYTTDYDCTGDAVINEDGTISSPCDNTAASTHFLTSSKNDAYIWGNIDSNNDGYVDPLSFTDNTLTHAEWQCEEVEYRIEQDICGFTHHTPIIGKIIYGALTNPWQIDEHLGAEVTADQGTYDNKVTISWANAIDADANILQFRLFRRKYEPLSSIQADYDLIFSSETETHRDDYDVEAGKMYEYKLEAMMGCSDDGSVGDVHPFPTEKSYIGYRTNINSIEGTVTYEEVGGDPSEDTMVEATPQGTNLVRNALKLPPNRFVQIDLPNTAVPYKNWPNLALPEVNGEASANDWSHSAWVKIATQMADGERLPIVGFNFKDYQSNPNEAFSIWAEKQTDVNGDPQLELQIGQAGSYKPFLDQPVYAPFNSYFHLSVEITKTNNNLIRVNLACDDNDIMARRTKINELPEPAYRILEGGEELHNEISAGWSSIFWNGASIAPNNCHSTAATNFEPYTSGSRDDACQFIGTEYGCADPAATMGGYSASVTHDLPWYAGQYDNTLHPCNYANHAFGKNITMRWFTDDSNPTSGTIEYPVVIDASNSEVIYSFKSQLLDYFNAINASGNTSAQYAFSMPALPQKMAAGMYSIRVLEGPTDNTDATGSTWTGLEAANFTGNFSVHDDDGVEYVNCIQYLPSSSLDGNGNWLAAGEYDFEVFSNNCNSASATAPPTSNQDLIIDCADSYSLRYLGDPAGKTTLNLTPHGQSESATNPFIEFWFKMNSASSGEIFRVDFGSGQHLKLAAVFNASNELEFELSDQSGNKLPQHTQLPEGVNEFELIQNKWYHCELQMGDASTQSFRVRPSDFNDTDFPIWNDTRYWIWNDPLTPNSVTTQNGNTLSKVELGAGAEVTIQRLSLWKNPDFSAAPTALFNGLTDDFIPSCTDCQGVWTEDANGIPWTSLLSVLIPTYKGTFADQMVGKQIHPNGMYQAVDETKVIWTTDGDLPSEQFSLTGAYEPTTTAHPNRKPTRCAPTGGSQTGCSRVYNACNFNPFSNVFGDCDLSCAGQSIPQAELQSSGLIVDEIRGFKNAGDLTSMELARSWRMKYPNNLEDGLFLMYDADEDWGNILYDRSKAASGWNNHNSHVMWQRNAVNEGNIVGKEWIVAPASQHYHFGTERDIPISLGNWDISDETEGAYTINNIKYSGTGTVFDVEPSKTSGGFEHSFLPASAAALLGDASIGSDVYFVDKSSFEVHVRVVYQDVQPDGKYTSGGPYTPSNCPVKSVNFKVDGVTAVDGTTNSNIETDANGYAVLSLPRGEHTLTPFFDHLDGNSLEDNHSFENANGLTVNITGPLDMTNALTFVDITVRRAVGRFIGGTLAAEREWSSSPHNNLGIANLWLSPVLYEDPVDDSAFRSIPSNACPAIQITTDATTGQYDLTALPITYVPAQPTDDDPGSFIQFPTGVSLNSQTDIINVQGWNLDLPGSNDPSVSNPGWHYAFRNQLFVDSEGNHDPNSLHQTWNLSELVDDTWTKFNYQQEINGVLTDYPEGLPSTTADDVRIVSRVDFVHQEPASLSAYQTNRATPAPAATTASSTTSSTTGTSGTDATTTTADPDCDFSSRLLAKAFHFNGNSALVDMDDQNDTPPAGRTKVVLGDLFVGEPLLKATGTDDKTYGADLTGYIRAHEMSVADPAFSATSIYPFPLGLPVIETGKAYCLKFEAKEVYSTTIVDNGELVHQLVDEAPLTSTGLTISVNNNLALEPIKSVPMSGPTAGQYKFFGAEPDLSSSQSTNSGGTVMPTGRFTASMTTGENNTVAWSPFEHLDYMSLTSAPDRAGIDPLYEKNAFVGIILGSKVSGATTPMSTDPSLLFILRDPPGDESFASITEGNSMSYSREIDMGSGTTSRMERNSQAGFGVESSGEWNIAPMGVGKSEGSSLSAGGSATMTQEEDFTRNTSGDIEINETLTFEQTITTSNIVGEVGNDVHYNQDLFFGKTRNKGRTQFTSFSLSPEAIVADLILAEATRGVFIPPTADQGDECASNPGSTLNTGECIATNLPAIPTNNADNDDVVTHLTMFEMDDAGQYVTTTDGSGNSTLNGMQFVPVWAQDHKVIEAPASMFMYTQYTIENIMIPQLKSLRDAYATNSGLYKWPTGEAITPSNPLPPSTWPMACPESMILANNDDPRWSMYHQDWLTAMESASAGSSNPSAINDWKVSTLKRGYQTGNSSSSISEDERTFQQHVLTDLFTSSNLGDLISDAFVDMAISTTLQGDDRRGPGYIFEASDADVAAASAYAATHYPGRVITDDIHIDSVRYYNNQIAQWSRILAKNELDKLNARWYISENQAAFADPDQINTWRDAMNNSSAAHLEFTMEDLANSSEVSLSNFGDTGGPNTTVDLWGAADFEPFVIAFSGGGAQFTQSISKTNTKSESHAMESAALLGVGGGASMEVGDFIGYNSSRSSFTNYTETRKNSQSNENTMAISYTLSDPDVEDFYLVAVVPGSGMDGPMFVTLGGVSSCPHQPEMKSKYWEWFPTLIPGDLYPHPSSWTCGETTTPVFGRGIHRDQIVVDNSGSGNWDPEGFETGGMKFTGADVAFGVMGTATAVAGGLTAAAASGLGCIGCAVSAGITTGVMVGVLAADIVSNVAFRTSRLHALNNWSSATASCPSTSGPDVTAPDVSGTTYGYTPGTDNWAICQGGQFISDTKKYTYDISSAVCTALHPAATDEVREEKLVINPPTVAAERAELTFSHDFLNPNQPDLVEVVGSGTPLSAPQNQSIGVTLHLKHSPLTQPYGDDAEYILFSEPSTNSAGFNVNLGGQGVGTIGTNGGLVLSPSWDPATEDFNVFMSVTHSGVDGSYTGPLDIVMQSFCDTGIGDTVRVPISFEPACSQVNLTKPNTGFVANLEEIRYTPSTTSSDLDNKMMVSVDVLREDFTNWSSEDPLGEFGGGPVVVEFRTDNSTWSPISNRPDYSTNGAITLSNGLLSDPSFHWNPKTPDGICGTTSGLACGFEGNITLRARSQCANFFAVDEVSEEIEGYLDFLRPTMFGEVLPLDHHYEIGDEIKLRWSEPMETTVVTESLEPTEVAVSGKFNGNFGSNSGGVAFQGMEYLAVPAGPHLHEYVTDLDVGQPGWYFSCKFYRESGQSVTAGQVGHLMTLGDRSETSLEFQIHSGNELHVKWYVNGNLVSSDSAILTNIEAGWNSLEIDFTPNLTNTQYNIVTNRSSNLEIDIPNFVLNNHRVTFGNGWSGGQATGEACPYPIQDIRLWSSIRETGLANNPQFGLYGSELGLQLWLPLNELEGTPVDQSKDRAIEMAGNWFSTQDAQALDLAGNTAANPVILSTGSLGATPTIARNATVEFWIKPQATTGQRSFMGINPANNIELDTEGNQWHFELNNANQIVIFNNQDSIQSSVSLSQTWHHVALVREMNQALTLYVDGENVASRPASDFGKLVLSEIRLGGRFTGTPGTYDRLYAGKFDELRVWTTNLPIATLRERTREAIQGYPDLRLHMPFQSLTYDDCETEVMSASTEYFSYNLNEVLLGYDMNDNAGLDVSNDASSMLNVLNSMCHADRNALQINCCGTLPAPDGMAAAVAAYISNDAPLMQQVSQTQTATDIVSSVSWNAMKDEVILAIDEAQLWKLEDQLVTFTLPKNQVRDANGNAVSSNVTFDLLIDRNPLNWGDDFISEVRMTDDAKTFTTSIVNSGYQVKTFEIVGAPDWLDVTPASGQIMPQSELTITLSAPDHMNIGAYALDLFLKGGLPCGTGPEGHCYGDRFALELDIQTPTPDFSVDSWAYESVCPVTAQVYINDIASNNPRNVILAYIGNELRGHAVTDMNVSGSQMAFLSVFFNSGDVQADGVTMKPIDFRVWDASTGLTRALCTAHHPTIHDDASEFLLTPNGHGSLFQPVRIKASSGVETQTELRPGWNWISFNVEPLDATKDYMEHMFSGISTTDIVQIKSHAQSKTYFQDGVWQPNMPQVDVNARFQVKMNSTNPDTLWTLSNLGNAATNGATIKEGWNDLGFVPQHQMSPETALRSLSDAELLQPNDMIASRYDGFALYSGDGEWLGSLNTMRPGQGYRLRMGTPDPSSAAEIGILDWPLSSTFNNPNWLSNNLMTGVSRPEDAWDLNVRDCADMMTMVARTNLPTDFAPSPGDHFGAFILDEAGHSICVGQALPMTTEYGVSFFLTIYRCEGDNPTLHFKWKSGISEVELEALEVHPFDASELMGSLEDPIQFTFKRDNELDADPGELVAYPNPFQNEVTVFWHGMDRVESLTVRDANGRIIRELNCNGINEAPCTWATSNIAPGVYFITAITDRGTRTIKVVK